MAKSKSQSKRGKKKHHIRREQRAELLFPIGRIARYLREGHFAPQYSEKAAIAMAAVLEYITEEVLILTHDILRKKKAVIIKPRHIREAIKEDDEFKNFLEDQLNVVINTHQKKKAKKPNENQDTNQDTQVK